MTPTPSPTPAPSPAPGPTSTWHPPGMDVNQSGNLVLDHTLIQTVIVLVVTVVLLRLIWRILRANWRLLAFCFGVIFLSWWLTSTPDEVNPPPAGPTPATTHHSPTPPAPRHHKGHNT